MRKLYNFRNPASLQSESRELDLSLITGSGLLNESLFIGRKGLCSETDASKTSQDCQGKKCRFHQYPFCFNGVPSQGQLQGCLDLLCGPGCSLYSDRSRIMDSWLSALPL